MITITMSVEQTAAKRRYDAASTSAAEAIEASAAAKRRHGKGSAEHKAALVLVDMTGDELEAASDALSATAGQETRD